MLWFVIELLLLVTVVLQGYSEIFISFRFFIKAILKYILPDYSESLVSFFFFRD